MFYTQRNFLLILNIATVVWLANLARMYVLPAILPRVRPEATSHEPPNVYARMVSTTEELLVTDVDDVTWNSYYRAVSTTVHILLGIGLALLYRSNKSRCGLFAYNAGLVLLFAVDWVGYLGLLRDFLELPPRVMITLFVLSGLVIVAAHTLVLGRARLAQLAQRLRR